MQKQITEQQAIAERKKYVSAFNDTMIKIWQEQITLLGVIDTGRLLHSPLPIGLSADGKFSQVQLSQAFLEYDLWQDFGTGGEVPPTPYTKSLRVPLYIRVCGGEGYHLYQHPPYTL